MKKAVILILAVFMAAALSGCELWTEGSYYSENPHKGGDVSPMTDQAEVSSSLEIHTFLTQMVESGTQNSMIYVSKLTASQAEECLQEAIDQVRRTNPIGAYAVRDIQYEVGTSTGRQAIALTVTYNHNRAEILRIAQVTDKESLISHMAQALDQCETGLVLRIGNIGTEDLPKLIRDYVEQNPDICMEMPQVTVNYYPQEGEDRVLELLLSYQNSPDDLRNMQQQVATVFASGELYVSGDSQPREKYSQLFSFLMERYEYTVETSITPSYSLLRYGVGDSKAFAMVYAAMCRRAGLQCQIVSGTRDGTPWHWNVIFEDGLYYHVDLLRSSQQGEFMTLLPEQMTGYVWDYADDLIDQEPAQPEPETSE